jgi:hypothetical protein
MRSKDVTFWQGRDLQAVQWTNSVPKPAGYQPACHLHNKVAAGPLAPPVADSLCLYIYLTNHSHVHMGIHIDTYLCTVEKYNRHTRL